MQTLSGAYDEVDLANHVGQAQDERDKARAERAAAGDRHVVPPQTTLTPPHVLSGGCNITMM